MGWGERFYFCVFSLVCATLRFAVLGCSTIYFIGQSYQAKLHNYIQLRLIDAIQNDGVTSHWGLYIACAPSERNNFY